MKNMKNCVVLGNYNEANAESVLKHFQDKLKKAEEDAANGILPKDEPVYRLIDDGPPPCEVTITPGSRKIIAGILCSYGE